MDASNGATAPLTPVGFIGMGIMGQPMALNLVRAGMPLVVWNRTPERCEPLRMAGAEVADSVAALFAQTQIVILMLINESVTDSVLGRGTPDFKVLVAGHIVVNMGSMPPSYARALESDIRRAGGQYMEVPVSGSRIPAEKGQLVGLMGGDAATVDVVAPC